LGLNLAKFRTIHIRNSPLSDFEYSKDVADGVYDKTKATFLEMLSDLNFYSPGDPAPTHRRALAIGPSTFTDLWSLEHGKRFRYGTQHLHNRYCPSHYGRVRYFWVHSWADGDSETRFALESIFNKDFHSAITFYDDNSFDIVGAHWLK